MKAAIKKEEKKRIELSFFGQHFEPLSVPMSNLTCSLAPAHNTTRVDVSPGSSKTKDASRRRARPMKEKKKE